MNKRMMLIGLMIFVTAGCAVNVKRGIQGDTFYSTYPELAIKIAPEFEYVNNDNANDFACNDGTETGMNSGSNYSIEQFVFEDRLTRKEGQILIKKLTGSNVYWDPDITSGVDNLLSSGFEEHQGERYRYAVFPIQYNDGSCYLAKLTGRVTGGNRDTLLEVFYFEPVGDIPQECQKWEENVGSLTKTQREALDRFMENSARNFKFVDLAKLELKR